MVQWRIYWGREVFHQGLMIKQIRIERLVSFYDLTIFIHINI